MKTIKAMLIVILTSSISYAYEIAENPDRYPSIGLSVAHGNMNGDHITTINPTDFNGLPPQAVNGGPSRSDDNSYGVDVRLPLSDWCTFGISYDHISVRQNFSRTVYPTRPDIPLFLDESKVTGSRLGFNVRLYIK